MKKENLKEKKLKILYIGQYSEGTTSKMRAEQLQVTTNAKEFIIIDTHIPFYQTSKLWRSLGFRLKKGPLIKNINRYLQQQLLALQISGKYDLIWVDKGVFISNKTTKKLREIAVKLVHFTPDMAFFENQSKMFNNSIGLYDFVITTKSPEKKDYLKRISEDKLLITTQGFSKENHKPMVNFLEKEKSVAFIGLAEPFRFKIMETLLNEGIKIKVAGFGWENFIEKHKENPLFTFVGKKLMNEEYTRFISSSLISWGALSKKFPEQHTTRTFEIPACGTALLTEYNTEIASFYKEDEVIFYTSTEELIKKVRYFFNHQNELKKIVEKGFNKVHENGYSYEAILRKLVTTVLK